MHGSQTRAQMKVKDNAAALRGAEVTLNEQLVRDTQGKLRDEVLDELAIAAQEIELALMRLSDRENRVELYQTLAQRAGIDLPPPRPHRPAHRLRRLAAVAGLPLLGSPRAVDAGRSRAHRNSGQKPVAGRR